MSKTKTITGLAIHSQIPARTQSHLDWNTRPKLAATPRREWQSVMRHFGPLWMRQASGTFPPFDGGVTQ